MPLVGTQVDGVDERPTASRDEVEQIRRCECIARGKIKGVVARNPDHGLKRWLRVSWQEQVGHDAIASVGGSERDRFLAPVRRGVVDGVDRGLQRSRIAGVHAPVGLEHLVVHGLQFPDGVGGREASQECNVDRPLILRAAKPVRWLARKRRAHVGVYPERVGRVSPRSAQDVMADLPFVPRPLFDVTRHVVGAEITQARMASHGAGPSLLKLLTRTISEN